MWFDTNDAYSRGWILAESSKRILKDIRRARHNTLESSQENSSLGNIDLLFSFCMVSHGQIK